MKEHASRSGQFWITNIKIILATRNSSENFKQVMEDNPDQPDEKEDKYTSQTIQKGGGIWNLILSD